jgi:broad specificity phosphatase PhoE
MKLLLIRHGQTAWNREQVFRGGTDVELDETGRKQARLLAQRLKDFGLSAVYSGPLSRARETAQAVAGACGLKVKINPGLDDMRFGKWEGLAHTEVAEKFPEAYTLWKSEPWRAGIPGGSSLDEVGGRAWAALQAMLSAAGERETVAVVTHRVVLKLLICRMLGLGPDGFWKVKLSPCSLTTFVWDGQKFVMEGFNDVCHLQDMAPGLMDF